MRTWLGLALWLTSMTSLSQPYWQNDIQAPLPEMIDETFVPEDTSKIHPALIPENCRKIWLDQLSPCQFDITLEWQLEREYWKHVGEINTAELKHWLKKTSRYIRLSDTPNAGRLWMLSIFGHLLVYSDGPMFDPLRMDHVLKSLSAARQATQLLPRSPNAWAFYWAMRNFIFWTLDQKGLGNRALDKMTELGKDYQEWGAAGPIGAAVHLMGARDPHLVRSGIQIYSSCQYGACFRLTSIAPFQDLGALITEAEAQGYLGRKDKMHELLDQARDLGQRRGWPFVEQVESYRQELIKTGGFLEQWRSGGKLGQFRAPLGIAHQPQACAFCHVGAKVPKHYYPTQAAQ